MTAGLPGTARAARDLADGWLAHLKRDDRGFPVPWVNRWGAESLASTRIAWDPHIGRRAAFFHDTGDVPDFTRQSMHRQREAMIRGLCQVCGRGPLPWSRRNLVLSGTSVEKVRIASGRAVAAINEPWLDDRCAAIATLLCPALIRRSNAEDLTLVAVRAQRHVSLLTSVGTLDVDTLEDAGAAHPDHVAMLRGAAARGPVGLSVKAVLLNHRIAFASDLEAAAGAQQTAPTMAGAVREIGTATV